MWRNIAPRGFGHVDVEVGVGMSCSTSDSKIDRIGCYTLGMSQDGRMPLRHRYAVGCGGRTILARSDCRCADLCSVTLEPNLKQGCIASSCTSVFLTSGGFTPPKSSICRVLRRAQLDTWRKVNTYSTTDRLCIHGWVESPSPAWTSVDNSAETRNSGALPPCNDGEFP